MSPFAVVWVSMIAGILGSWLEAPWWLLVFAPVAWRSLRLSILGLVMGLLLGSISLEQKFSQIEQLTMRGGLIFLSCEDFRGAKILFPEGGYPPVRTQYYCPPSQGFVSFGSLSLKRDLSFGIRQGAPWYRFSFDSGNWLYEFRVQLAELLTNDWKIQTGFRRALLLGDGSQLPPTIWKAMNSLGLSHLLVASGMHLVFSALLIKKILSWGFRFLVPPSLFSLWAYRLCLLVLMSLYSLLLGFDISIARAWWVWMMTEAVSFFHPLGLRLKGVSVLAVTGMIILILDPTQIFDVSYALSFGTSWFIIQTGSVFLTSLSASLMCGYLGLASSLLSPLVNGLVAGPLFAALVPVSLIPLLAPSLGSLGEFLVANVFRLLTELSFRLPLLQLSPLQSAVIFVLIVLVAVEWRSKSSIFKVYFDNSRLVSLTLRLLSRKTGSDLGKGKDL